MPAWLVPAMMGGKMALDLIGGFQARRDARERQQKMNEQSARGRFLSHLSPKAALGVAGSPQIPIPNIADVPGARAANQCGRCQRSAGSSCPVCAPQRPPVDRGSYRGGAVWT